MDRRTALPLIQDARARLTQAEAICKSGYPKEFSPAENTAIEAMLGEVVAGISELQAAYRQRKGRVA